MPTTTDFATNYTKEHDVSAYSPAFIQQINLPRKYI